MTSSLAITPPAADPNVGQSAFSPTEILSPAAVAQDQTAVPDPADLRLVIEEDKAAGAVEVGDALNELRADDGLEIEQAAGAGDEEGQPDRLPAPADRP